MTIRVGFIPKRADTGAIALSARTVLSVRQELYDRHGFDLCVDHERDVDLLWVHRVHLLNDRAHLLDSTTPLIVDEERDAATVAPDVRKWAKAGLCCGVVKPHLYRPRERYEHPNHARFDFGLLELSAGYPQFERLDILKTGDLDYTAARMFDVHFAGWMSYAGKEPEQHRARAADAVEGLRNRNVQVYRGRLLDRATYYAQLSEAKICLSPFGWAEACHRDAEGIFRGCVLVKPFCDYIETLPDLYRAGETYEVCAEDFSDLPEVVGRIVDNWGQYEERRRDNRNWIIESSKRWRLAAHIARVFRRCLERAA